MSMFYGSLMPIFSLAIFGLAFGIIISRLIKGAKSNRTNNASPRITAETSVVTKRTHVWGDHSHTTYFATFQFESGDRLELEIPRDRFGYLVEGDKGKLTFQGTRFLDFQRQ